MVKTENFVQFGTEILNKPDFSKGKTEHPRLWHVVRVTSRLLMDQNDAIASDPQVGLLALIWCEIGIF